MGCFVSDGSNIGKTYFEKVSREQFRKDWLKAFDDEYDADNENDIAEIDEIYDAIEIPKRATVGSAGYDFQCPINMCIKPGDKKLIPSGIRCHMPLRYVMMLYPRSSLSIKYGLCLSNQTAVIDSDYFHADNEGHIQIPLVNNGNERIKLEQGQNVCQGVIVEYHVADDDVACGVRSGGIGSTDRDAIGFSKSYDNADRFTDPIFEPFYMSAMWTSVGR